MTPADQAAVRREIVVNAPIDHAFATFVERFGDFKPKEHNLLGAPITSTTPSATWLNTMARRGQLRAAPAIDGLPAWVSASRRFTRLSSSAGNSPNSTLVDSAIDRVMTRTRASRCAPSKGRSPVRASNATTPIAQRSHR